MKPFALILALTTTAASCGQVMGISDSALCAGTDQATTEHAAGLAVDGGPVSLATGAALISKIDAGCGR